MADRGRTLRRWLRCIFCSRQPLALLILLAAGSIPAFGIVGACSDFSATGSLARATVRGTSVELELRRASESTFAKVPLTLKIASTACTAFFSKDETYLALGFHNPGKPQQNIQLAVLRVATGHWVDQIPLVVTMAADSRGTLRGFIANTHTVVVMNNGSYFPGERTTSVFPVLINVDTAAIRTGAVSGAGFGVSFVSSVIDVAHNRLWLRDKHLPCTLRAFTIDTDRVLVAGTPNATVQLGCSLTDLLAAADPDFLLQLTREENNTLVRRIDWRTKSVAQIELGRDPRRDAYLPNSELLATSDNGSVIGLSALRLTEGRLGSTTSDRVLILVGADPLRVIGTVPWQDRFTGLSLFRSSGSTSISYFDGAAWKVDQLPDASSGNASQM